MASESTNALKDLLRSGLSYGSEYAAGKLFGAPEADETQMQEEKLRFAQVNGSGPVNGAAALRSPKSWTDLFFGTRGAAAPNDPAGAAADSAGGPSPVAMIALVGVIVVVLWLVSKKFK